MASARSVITVGTFDGVHLGHGALVRRACVERGRMVAADGVARAVRVVAFDPHPASVLRGGAGPARLSTWTQRERWLREAGADEVERLAPTPKLLALEGEAFAREVAQEHGVDAWVEGRDFRFGRGRAGDVELLARVGREAGFGVHVVEPVEAPLGPMVTAGVSSTLIRALVAAGRVTDAAGLLGRAYELDGTVVRGDRRGRELGFPTANIETACLLPADGVYAGRAVLPDGHVVPAAVHVGGRAQFDAPARTLEAHLIGVSRGSAAGEGSWALDGLEEYGWRIRLELSAYLRDQARFESVAALVAQIRRDCARVLEVADSAGLAGSVGATEDHS